MLYCLYCKAICLYQQVVIAVFLGGRVTLKCIFLLAYIKVTLQYLKVQILVIWFKSIFFLLMQEVLRNLVKRYVAAMIRDAKTEEGLTEENFKVGTSNKTGNKS